MTETINERGATQINHVITDVDETYTTKIPRGHLGTSKDLAEHIREIGRIIMEEAELLSANMKNIYRIEINACVSTEMTSNITYDIKRCIISEKGKLDD